MALSAALLRSMHGVCARLHDYVGNVGRMQNGTDAADGLEQLVHWIPSGHGVSLQRFWKGPLQ